MLGLLLAHRQPVDLINGQKIDVDKSLAWSNDKEYHHFFPKAYLATQGVDGTAANVVGNIILLTSVSNIAIRDSAPSAYLQKIIETSGREAVVQRLASNLVPEDALDAALKDDYQGFLAVRGAHLHQHMGSLTGSVDVADASPDPADDLDTDADPSD